MTDKVRDKTGTHWDKQGQGRDKKGQGREKHGNVMTSRDWQGQSWTRRDKEGTNSNKPGLSLSR